MVCRTTAATSGRKQRSKAISPGRRPCLRGIGTDFMRGVVRKLPILNLAGPRGGWRSWLLLGDEAQLGLLRLAGSEKIGGLAGTAFDGCQVGFDHPHTIKCEEIETNASGGGIGIFGGGDGQVEEEISRTDKPDG